jgi:signal transduction histidine kinase
VSAVPKSRPTHPVPFPAKRNQIFGTGEMADLTRAFDWSLTSVGPIDQWPEALLTTVNTMLASRHPMFLWWGDDLVQFYNDGYRPSIREDKHPHALGQNGRDCWPEIWSIIGPQIDAVMTTGEATWHENQLVPINRNGKLEDVYWTYGYSPVRDAAGSICGTLVVCTETTQSVLANNQLQQERERLADLFQQAPAFFAVLQGPSHVFEMANPPYQDLIGHRDIQGRPLAEAVPESIEQGFVALLDTVYRTGEPYIGRNTPIELVRTAAQPPELRYLDFVYQPRRDANGTVSGIIVLGVDVTENLRVEEALLQAEKLAAVGRLASSIAHEINNPLEAVTNLIYLAQHAAIKPEVREYLNTAEAELRRVSGIARQTLRFHRQSTNATPIAMPDLIGDTLPFYQGRLINAGIRLQRRDRSRLPVTCFEGEIRQVLSNLLGNAIDAIGANGGRILIRSREATHWSSGSRGVLLTVADTGSGMSKTAQGKIFDAFFTTKGASGTGLGLWISRQIVERHRGDLRVRSSQSPHAHGTVFTLFLPAGDDLAA